MSASASAPAARTDADIVLQNPVSGEMAGRVPDMTAEVSALVCRARSAQAAWGARPVEERAEVLAAMRRWIVANRTAIVESTMRETGKTYEDALFNEGASLGRFAPSPVRRRAP
jgi:acyl-CoA reductase-like NAD-dependent aldehyde dehydrogenase